MSGPSASSFLVSFIHSCFYDKRHKNPAEVRVSQECVCAMSDVYVLSFSHPLLFWRRRRQKKENRKKREEEELVMNRYAKPTISF